MTVTSQLIFFMLIITNFDHVQNNDDVPCPPLQKGCGCTHISRVILKILCADLKYVSMGNLPTNVSFEVTIRSSTVTSLKASSFPHPNQINKLYIRGISLSAIEKGTFEGFDALKILDLSKNHLVQLLSSTFRGLKKSNLTDLNLKQNRILKISKTAFSELNIKSLDLSDQRNAQNAPALLLSYSDFLSFSNVKRVDLSGNNFLCDCNMRWLPLWAAKEKNEVSPQTRCFYPLKLRHTLVNGLSQDTNWDCDKYKGDFTLPEFDLYPYLDQLVFENDTVEYFCNTTWMESSRISWFMNGMKVVSNENANIKISVDYRAGLLISKLVIKRLAKSYYGNITCSIDAKGSGSDYRSRNIFLIWKSQETCQSNITNTNKGYINWPTSLGGAVVKTQCPFGSLTKNSFAERHCTIQNGWSDMDVSECFFSDPTTKKLQKLYAESRLHSIPIIRQMASKLSRQFSNKHHLIISKYDLYFFYNILNDIRITFKGNDGKKYSRFFWNATGMITDNHQNVEAMAEKVDGRTAGWRFRRLLEEFIGDQIRLDSYKRKFSFHNHHSMSTTSLSVSSTVGVELHCYLTTATNLMLQINCYPRKNYTANKLASVVITMYAGVSANVYRLTLMTYLEPTFFQSSNASLGDDGSKQPIYTSSIIGFRWAAKLKDGSITTRIPNLELAFSKKAFNLEKPRLAYWSEEEGGWKPPSSCNGVFRIQNNASVYICRYIDVANMTYLTVLTEKPKPTFLLANLLEPIIYIAASLGCVLLLLTMAIYLYFCYIKQLLHNRTDSIALINLCLVLVVTEIIFAVGIHRVDDELLCRGVAAGLHYFILCAYVWLGCGGVALLRLVKKKDRADVKAYDPVLKYYLVGWGFPMIIVGITIAFDYGSYGTDQMCWLQRETSLGAFIAIGCIIVLGDLVIYCLLHAAINRLFPAPLEDDEGHKNESENEDENCNRDECSAKQCRYKQNKKKKLLNTTKVYIPERKELLQTLHGGLLVLLLLSASITFLIMVYSYKDSKARYLYFLFTYGSAFCNFLVGFVIFYNFCIKRKDLRKLLKDTFVSLRRQNNGGGGSDVRMSLERQAFVEHDSNTHDKADDETFDRVEEEEDIAVEETHTDNQNENFDNAHPEMRGSEDEEAKTLQEKSPESAAALNDQHHLRTPFIHSEISENEHFSNAPNSIGECSLVSSGKRNTKPAAKPVELPTNLKNFVPENWRPARRRMNKGASYYPYYVSDNAPISASLAYSSKSSSLASTTVSGVPLYKKNHAHHSIQPPLAFHSQAPRIPPNAPIRFAPPPVYIPPTTANNFHHHHPPVIDEIDLDQTPESEAETQTGLVESETDLVVSETDLVEPETDLVEENELEKEETSQFVVSPNLYIPMPHVSIKQFILRNETSV